MMQHDELLVILDRQALTFSWKPWKATASMPMRQRASIGPSFLRAMALKTAHPLQVARALVSRQLSILRQHCAALALR